MLLSLSGADAGEKGVVVQGRVVCLDAADEPSAEGKDCPDEPDGGWAIRATDGTLHRLAPQDRRVVMLSDTRVRSRELRIEGWRDDEGELSIVQLHSIVDGQLHQPHYYCQTCAIRDYRPGLCTCCREPYEFREPKLEE